MNKLVVLLLCSSAVIITIVALVTLLYSDNEVNKDLETLQLVTVLFRHGDRTNDRFTVYPTDPNRNYSYAPYGYGRLTNKGKLKVFRIGEALNEKYSSFLIGDNPEDVYYATSSASPRALVSLQLLLAGLFPPKYVELWNRNLYWQPLPYTVIPRSHDKVLQGYKCPNYVKLFKEYCETAENAINMKNFTKLFTYLSKHTGWNIKSLEEAAFVHASLQIEEEFGLKLPGWSKSVWPEPIKTAQHQCYYQMTATNLMMKYTIGFLLKKIIKDNKAKINNEIPLEKKIFLYSAHDYNIGFFLRALNIFDRSRNPKYGAYITIELHKIDENYYFKMFYENYNYDRPELLNIPNCGVLCPIDKFERIMLDYLPDENLKCGTEDDCNFR